MVNVVDSISYVIIPSKLLFDSTVPPNAKILYGQIKVLCHKDGYCYATNKYFANNNNLNVRTVSRLINILYEKGYIDILYTKESSNYSKRKVYTLDGIGVDKIY